jgi:hypothetical protein
MCVANAKIMATMNHYGFGRSGRYGFPLRAILEWSECALSFLRIRGSDLMLEFMRTTSAKAKAMANSLRDVAIMLTPYSLRLY